MGEAFNWNSSRLIFYAIIAALICISLLVKNGLAYSIPVAGFHIALFVLLERGAMNGLTHPSSWWFWWPVAWNFVVLSLAWAVLPNGRTVALAAFFRTMSRHMGQSWKYAGDFFLVPKPTPPDWVTPEQRLARYLDPVPRPVVTSLQAVLPAAVQEELAEGIGFGTEEALAGWLENMES
jgi:hypothetical protein